MQLTSYRRIAMVLAFAFPIAALADLNQTTTLQANQTLNLDTGATGSSGGDVLWNGSTIAPQGTAKAVNFGALGSIDIFTKSYFDALKVLSSSSPIPAASLVVGDVFAVFTNGGNTAGLLVTAKSGGSITLQSITFIAVVPTGPTITQVLNNSSEIPNGFPSSGIAQGSLFKVLGTGLAATGDATLHSSEGSGLLTTLNGASITVTVGATVVHPALYYATPTQIDGVLPAATPTGAGTLTVTYSGTVSSAVTIKVVIAAPGITIYNGSGVGQHALTAALITYTASAAPGETIILWGTGLGATSDSPTTYTDTPHQTTVPYTIYIGGVAVTPAYSGRSVYPGVDVFGVVIPQNVPTGCWVSLAAVTGTVVSNVVTLPINPGGGACVDAQTGLNGDQITAGGGGQTLKTGLVAVIQTNTPKEGVTNVTDAAFEKYTGIYSPQNSVSPGGCIVSFVPATVGSIEGLDVGTIGLTGPGGLSITLASQFGIKGAFYALLGAGAIPATGGTFTFTGSGGTDVGAFTSTVTFTNPLFTWTNQGAAASIDRTQGLHVTWSGGNPGSYVFIYGGATSGGVTGSYTCLTTADAGQFTVPSYILLTLPAGSGSTGMQNAIFSLLTASGLDIGVADGTIADSVSSTYQ